MIIKLKLFIDLFIICILSFSFKSMALEEAPQAFHLSGTLYQAGTSTPLQDPNTTILIQIIDPSKTCLLYEEQQIVNIGATGAFNIQVGSARNASKRTTRDPKNPMTMVFQNTGIIFASNLSSSHCIGGMYTPTSGDTRYIRLTVTPSSTNVPDRLSPDIAINSAPSALVAQSVQGLERNKILQVKESASVLLNQNSLEWLFNSTNYPNLQTVLSGSLVAAPNSGVSLPSISNNPSSPTEGAIWYDSVAKIVKYSNGTTTIPVGAAGSGISSVTVGSNLTADGVAGGTLSAPGTIDLKDSGVAAGSYAKVTVNTKGLVTAGTTLAEADIPTLSTAGKVSGAAINAGTIGGSAAVNTSGHITTTGTVTANNVSTNAVYSTAINGGSTASANLTLDSTSDVTKGNIVLAPSGGNVGIGTSSPGAALDVKGAIRLSGSTSGYTGFQPAAAAGSTVWTLPATDGTNGQVLTTSGAGILSWSTPATSAITSLNGQTGATQTFATPGTTGTAPNWSSATNAHTLHIPMAATASVTAGLISKTEYDTFNAKLGTATSFSGDVSGAYNSTSVDKIKGTAVSASAPTAAGQVLRYNGTTSYVPAFLSLADIRSTVTPANTMFPASTCTAAQTMTWSSLTDTMSCTPIAIANTAVSGLGTAATLNVGTGNNNIVQLDGTSKLPAVDGSQLTNVVAAWSAITSKPTTISGYGITNAITNVSGTPSVESGVFASRPAAGTAGRLYISTDTKIIYRDTASAWEAIGDGGGVSSITAGTGLSGGTISTSGTINLADTAVVANSYGNSTSVATFTVDAQGRLTTAATTAIPTADTNTKGLLTGADWTTFNSKLGTATSFSGDISGAYNSTSVDKIKGTAVSTSAPTAAGQVLRYNGTTSYIPAFLSLADIRSTVTPTDTMFPATSCTAAQTMTWSSLTDTMSCTPIAIAAGAITSGTLAVANGGTGTATGSITGTTALTFAAGGSNQNVTLTPSGTGYTVLNGNVGVGTSSPAATLDVNGNLKVGDAGLACAAGTAGAQRYNTTTKTMQFCNGTSWVTFGGNVLIGSLKMASASNCYWSSNSTSWTLYSATAACSAATVTGAATSPGKYPGITFSSLTPGTYEVQMDVYFGPTDNSGGSWGSATAACSYSITDGTSSGASLTLDSMDGQDKGESIRGIFSYAAAQGSTTFTLQTKRMTGTGGCVATADTNSGTNTYRSSELFITVKRIGD